MNSHSQAEWGFLKNIVNIDTFFASGPVDHNKQHQAGTSTAQKDFNVMM